MLGNRNCELEELATGYFRSCHQDSDEDTWAWEEVNKRIETDIVQAWSTIQMLIERANSDFDLSCVAAGPLGDFVDLYGDAALDMAETACEGNQRMRTALCGIGLLRDSPVLGRWQATIKKYGHV